MILFPNAKINIGLQILSKRADGYHNISTFFYPVPIYDILEIVKSDDDNTEINVTGNFENIKPEDNLCMKAYQLLSQKYNISSVKIYLHKIIPTGSGLAGGSSDAAFTLKALNILFDLQIDSNGLKNIAAQIGSDCAFFIDNKPSIASSRGEIITNFNIKINKTIVIVIPHISVSTSKAYSLITPNPNVTDLKTLLAEDINNWRHSIINDFEYPIFKIYPEIKEIKDKLYQYGAIYSSMSGSGSSVYGIFDHKPQIGHLFNGLDLFIGTI